MRQFPQWEYFPIETVSPLSQFPQWDGFPNVTVSPLRQFPQLRWFPKWDISPIEIVSLMRVFLIETISPVRQFPQWDSFPNKTVSSLRRFPHWDGFPIETVSQMRIGTWSTPWFGCMFGTNSLIWRHTWCELIDLDACLEPARWFGCPTPHICLLKLIFRIGCPLRYNLSVNVWGRCMVRTHYHFCMTH